MDNDTETFLNDLILEAQYQLTGEGARIPMAILLVSTWPTGDEAVSVGKTEIGVKTAAAYDLSERTGLGLKLKAISVDGGDKREIFTQASVALGLG